MTSAAIRRVASPSPEELIGRAREMVPEIRALAEETERNRTISPHIIGKIRDAELLRTCRPKEFGGFEYDAVVALEIALVISAACASTGWTMNGALSNGISFGHFPVEAQRELWGGDADPFTCACFAPTGTAVPADDGYVLSGKWSFASGCDHSSWIRLGGLITPPDAEPPHEGAFFCCRSRMSRSSTIGSCAACQAPAARILPHARPSCQSTACYCLPRRARAGRPARNTTRTHSTACRSWCPARRCWPRPRSARPAGRSMRIWR
jgi:hypothetical protein